MHELRSSRRGLVAALFLSLSLSAFAAEDPTDSGNGEDGCQYPPAGGTALSILSTGRQVGQDWSIGDPEIAHTYHDVYTTQLSTNCTMGTRYAYLLLGKTHCVCLNDLACTPHSYSDTMAPPKKADCILASNGPGCPLGANDGVQLSNASLSSPGLTNVELLSAVSLKGLANSPVQAGDIHLYVGVSGPVDLDEWQTVTAPAVNFSTPAITLLRDLPNGQYDVQVTVIPDSPANLGMPSTTGPPQGVVFNGETETFGMMIWDGQVQLSSRLDDVAAISGGWDAMVTEDQVIAVGPPSDDGGE
ncbi:MAG: hypothetical protein AAF533_02310 [Acidobacteriota bacterium]